jgi:hypothetical protein
LKAAPLALAGLVLALFLPQQVRLAEQKPFGLDEGFEWANNCGQPALELIVRGAVPQCSPSPAYYLVEKLVARSIAIRDERILVTYRALGLLAASALVLALAWRLGARLGLPCALTGLASLLGQPLFHYYAVESRPYALSLCLLTLVLLLLAEGSERDPVPGRAWTAAFACASVGASLVLLTGAAQAVVACAAFLLLLRIQGVSLRSLRGKAAAVVLAICVACALYYRARSTCLAGDAGPLSVWGPQGRHLLGEVVRLIWTDAPAANVLALIGCAAPVWAWRRGAARERSESFVLALGLQVLAQVLLTVVLAAQVAWADYYFLPRLFLHLIVCRALLLALGTWLLLRLLSPTRWRMPAQVTAGLLAAAYLSIALVLLRQDADERREMTPWRARAAGPCLRWEVPLKLLLTGEPEWHFGPNLLVEAAHEAGRCGATPADGPRYLVASPEGGREIVSVPPTGAVPLRQCGREVELRPRGVR